MATDEAGAARYDRCITAAAHLAPIFFIVRTL
jgi:hypothetical protein